MARFSRRAALRILTAAGAIAASAGIANASPPDLAVGQEWSAKDTAAKVVIGRIETVGGAEVVSVSLLDVPTPKGPAAFGHAPFEKSALVASLDQLLATGVAPGDAFEAGYQQWKSAHGGYFTVSVAFAIGIAMKTLQTAQPAGAGT